MINVLNSKLPSFPSLKIALIALITPAIPTATDFSIKLDLASIEYPLSFCY